MSDHKNDVKVSGLARSMRAVHVQRGARKEGEVVVRQDAIERGLSRYFTGEPCRRGHVSERWTMNSACIQCVEEKREGERRRMAEGKLRAAGASG